jgi:hypothetical protein
MSRDIIIGCNAKFDHGPMQRKNHSIHSLARRGTRLNTLAALQLIKLIEIHTPAGIAHSTSTYGVRVREQWLNTS